MKNNRLWLWFALVLVIIGFGYPAVFYSINKVGQIVSIKVGEKNIVMTEQWTPVCSSDSWLGNKILGHTSNPTLILWNTGAWWLGTSTTVAVSFHKVSINNDPQSANVKSGHYSWGSVIYVAPTLQSANKAIAVLQPYSLVVAADDEQSLKQFVSAIKSIN